MTQDHVSVYQAATAYYTTAGGRRGQSKGKTCIVCRSLFFCAELLTRRGVRVPLVRIQIGNNFDIRMSAKSCCWVSRTDFTLPDDTTTFNLPYHSLLLKKR